MEKRQRAKKSITKLLVGESAAKKTVTNIIGGIESSTGVLQWQTENAQYVSGNGYINSKYIKITGSGNVRKAQLLTAGMYTFSAYIKTENTGGAYLDVVRNGSSIIQSRTVKGTNGYQRLFVTFPAAPPSGSSDDTITLKVVSSSGMTYVDALQLEKGDDAGKVVKNQK